MTLMTLSIFGSLNSEKAHQIECTHNDIKIGR